MISFFCPFCKHVMKTPDESAGKLIDCDQCKLEIRVPQPIAAPPASPVDAVNAPGHRKPMTNWWKRLFGQTNR